MNEKDCLHRKIDQNGVCPDCNNFITFYDYYDRGRQSFRFNEDGEVVDVFRGSEHLKEYWEVAGATEGVGEGKRRY